MSIGLIAGAGIAIAASVGPAREWRGAMQLAPGNDSPVDRSRIVKSEGGVPGAVVPDPAGVELIRERVPIQDLLIKPPVSPAQKTTLIQVPGVKRSGGPVHMVPVVWIGPPPEPEKKLGIPTNTSPVPTSVTQKTGETQIRTDGPTESAPAQRMTVKTTPGADGWNKVETTTVGFQTSNPDRAKYIDKEVEAAKKMMEGKGPYALGYHRLDPRDPDTSMTPYVDKRTMDVHDSQMHLFERAEQTQQRIETAKQSMAGGDLAPMQKLFHDIPDAQAAANKTRVYRGPRSSHPTSTRGIYGMRIDPGSIDPQLVRDDNAAAAEAEILALSGVDRFEKLISRGDSDDAIEYLNRYLVENAGDGRAYAALGLHQIASKKSDLGLKNLAKACDLAASAFAEPMDLKAIGVSQSAVADALGRLMGQKEQNKGMREAMALAAASFSIGRFEAANKLLEHAVTLGMDKTEAASLAALWKAHK